MIIIQNKQDLNDMREMVDDLLDIKNPTEQDRNLFKVYAQSIKYYEDKIKLNQNDGQTKNSKGST